MRICDWSSDVCSSDLERAIDLVGGDMQEAERILRIAFQCFPVVARGFQQRQRAHDVGLHEGARAVNRAVETRRASSGERACQYGKTTVGAGSLKTTR